MQDSAQQLAHLASLQAFINCYIREVDLGVWHNCTELKIQTGITFEQQESTALELQLSHLGVTLIVGVAYRSVVGRHVFTKSLCKQHNLWTWQEISPLNVIMLLIDNIYAANINNSSTMARKVELLTRTLESVQVMESYLHESQKAPIPEDINFIDSEHSLLFGHWLHPTPKSRQGMHAWQHKEYTPELKSHFQLHYFAVSRKLLKQNSLVEQSVEEIINNMAEIEPDKLPTDKQLIPVHPLQAHWLTHQDYVKELLLDGTMLNLGALGKHFTPTSSVRTLYCAQLDYMLKLSIPVKITNSLRRNMDHELEHGLTVCKLLAKSDFSQQFPTFSLIEDPAYITVKLPNMQESGFETIVRDNPFKVNSIEERTTLSIAALVQEPIEKHNSSLLCKHVEMLALERKVSNEEAALLWFNQYWQCAIEPAICLYDGYGVALEAHQQNSLLTITENLPTKYYYRDNQGFYLSKEMQSSLLENEPRLENSQDLFYDDTMIADRFGYYLFVNQLFSIIGRLGQDNLVCEKQLLQLSHHKLAALKSSLKGVGVDFIERLFNQPMLPCKANLLTRVEDVDELEAEQELAVYAKIKNPFFALHQHAKTTSKDVSEVTLASA